MKTVIINGLWLGLDKSVTGIQCSCRELIYRLDALLEHENLVVKYLYCVDFPNLIVEPDKLKSIQLIPVRLDSKPLWRPRMVRRIVGKEDAVLCCLSLEPVLVKNQVSFIYDIRPVTTKFDNLDYRIHYFIYMLIQKMNARFILTPSEYQKREIIKYLHIKDNSRVVTLYNGYEHLEHIERDDNIFNKYPLLRKKEYYYTLGTIAPHKNLKWVIEVASRNPDKLFVIAGGKDPKAFKDSLGVVDNDNILFVGYVSDEENRSLMENCRAFLHPSKYEGFGIPPLEALYYSTKTFISNATCLPEVYEDTAVYFSPDDYDVDLEAMEEYPVASSKKLFEKYSWDKAANGLLDILKVMAEEG